MRSKPYLLCVLVASLHGGAAAAQSPNDAAYKVGVASRHILPAGPYDWRGAESHALLEAIWYPADGNAQGKPQQFGTPGQEIFAAAPATANAKIAPAPGKFPLIMLSHGTGGTVQTMAWLAIALAGRGYIVAGVNHPGNTAMAPYTTQGFLLWWLRAKDMTTALDDILGDDEFGPRIDPRRIGAAGFSLGGYTVIELAGGITSRRQFLDYCGTPSGQPNCKPPPEFADLIEKSKALASSDPVFAQALRGDEKSYRDRRIRAVFAIAPAVGPAVTPNSLAAISIPVEIVAGEADSIAPIDANARYYAGKIPRAELTIFPGAVGHYTFLDECTPAGRDTRPLLCADAGSVDRGQIHAATIELAAKFFGGHL